MTNNTDSPAGIADGERIAQISGRLEKLKPYYPWEAYDTGDDYCEEFEIDVPSERKGCVSMPIAKEIAEREWAEFIANSPTDVEWLLARLKRAEAERDILRTRVVAQEAAWLERLMQSLEKESVKSIVEERDRLREALELADELMDAMDTWLALKDEPPQSWLTAGTQVCLAADRLRNHRAAAALADAGKGWGE